MELLFGLSPITHLDRLEKISRDAGDAILEIYQKAIDVSYKSDHSPLTEADLKANHIIENALKKYYPSLPILSEEEVIDFKEFQQGGFYWLVDPLDGTKEFIKRNGEFTVNIALIQKGEPILGVVFAPEKKILYRAAKNHGAYKREAGGNLKNIRVARHVLGSSLIVMGSRSHQDKASQKWFQNLGEHQFIPMGSSLKICHIAEGLAHIYPRFGPTSLWDTAAAHIILKEAGGDIKDLNGQTLNYDTPGQLLNPQFIASS